MFKFSNKNPVINCVKSFFEVKKDTTDIFVIINGMFDFFSNINKSRHNVKKPNCDRYSMLCVSRNLCVFSDALVFQIFF